MGDALGLAFWRGPPDDAEGIASPKVGAERGRPTKGASGAILEIGRGPGPLQKETLALQEVETGQSKRRRRARRSGPRLTSQQIVDEANRWIVPGELSLPSARPKPGAAPSLYRGAELEAEKVRVVVKSMAANTSKGYATAWRQWQVFRRRRGKEPALTGGDEDEEELLTFVIYLSGLLGNRYSTVKGKIMGVRSTHLINGLADPLLHKPRFWLAMRGLKRIEPETARKFPVTIPMLRFIRDGLAPFNESGVTDWSKEAGTGDRRTDTVLWSGVNTAFFFLLRASEWCAHDEAAGPDLAKVLTGDDVTLNEREGYVTIRIRGSKTDQYNLGCVRTVHASGDGEICVVKALTALFRQFPERRQGGTESYKPLFRLPSGAMLLRSLVQAWLSKAAVSEGLPGDRYGSHSLRIGGATAIYLACGETETPKRFGRWASGSFSLYLWESRSSTQQLARQMVEKASELQLEAGVGAQTAAQQAEKRRVRFRISDVTQEEEAYRGGEMQGEAQGRAPTGRL